MKLLVTAFLLLGSYTLSAQTLFYYGNDSVSVNEFLRAYKKNNTGVRSDKALNDYLDLYIASRLKIREARAMGLDTLPQLISDLENLRQQIIPSYLNDRESVNKLVDEAFTRAQKDIHLAHIFISFTQAGDYDTVAAANKAKAAMAAVAKAGSNFDFIAKDFSDDPAAKTRGAELGWITVFDLPYELENLAYATPPGKVSALYKSKAGYHIFKNLGERKDPGKLKAAQILLAFPPDADEQTKSRVKKLADSLYMRIQKGDDFGKLAVQFSNDVISAASNGQMQEFGIGEFDPEFEKAAFALTTDGAYTKPFLTAHGYHIVKRISLSPVNANKNDEKAMQALREKVEQSDRMATTKAALTSKILKSAGFKKAAYDESELYALSDSMLVYKPMGKNVHLTVNSPLFQLGKKTYTVSDWISYAQTFRYKSDGSGIKPYDQLWKEFVEAMAIEFYQANLETYNEDFRSQIAEFRDGNLFFEIMQQKIWGPAQSDTAALVNYYNRNRAKYNWNQSADAVIFYAPDAATAKHFSEELKRNPADWKHIAADHGEQIAADSSRFELAQIPNASKLPLKAGVITEPLVNKADNSTSFAYVLHPYTTGGPRSFAEARGLVINDYQAELEKQWLAELKKKYPVRMNARALEMVRKK
jgi:peptidyl-prolyl cis-trans isomerase SurA